LKKKYYYAKTAHNYLKRYGNRKYIKNQISPIYRLKLFMLNKRFWANPTLAIGVLTMKLLEYIISIIGFITGHS